MAQPRDYKAEYRRRIERAAHRGHSRSQARGHAKAGEKPLKVHPVRSDPKLELALRQLRHFGKLVDAAKSQRISPERFRRFLLDQDIAKRQARRWQISDNRPREMTMISRRGVIEIKIIGHDPASRIGHHAQAVKTFLRTNDASVLPPFDDETVTDLRGQTHMFETRPNTLYRLGASGSEVFEQVYRIVT